MNRNMDEQTYLAHMRQAETTLYHVACTLLRSESDRKDAMQETALRCWEHRDALREERYFTTWAVRIMMNVCYGISREKRRMVPVEQVAETAAPPSGDAELRLLLDALPDKYRLPLVLTYLEGFSSKDLARALGVSEGAARFRLYRARKALRMELDDGKEAD